jgi:hypothetical protein
MSNRQDSYYEIATLELSRKELVPAIWGRAYSEAVGDAQRASALYIKLRVAQLESEDRQSQVYLWRKDGSRNLLIWIMVAVFSILGIMTYGIIIISYIGFVSE